ncbi:MAG: ABC transporter ATP-binding protein, partial [Prevotella sp.]|nr:ABC transporter ATP-binding protein [Prevotella sp.]
MKDFITLIKRFVPPYKRQVVLNIIFNILSAFLNVFSFALIIPILEVLFKINEKVYTYQPIDTSSMASMFDAKVLINNFYWYMTDITEKHSGGTVLLVLGLFLVGMTILKTLTTYLSSVYIVSIRTGVVRDIRKRINDKIVSLPLGFFSNERKGDIIARMTG